MPEDAREAEHRRRRAEGDRVKAVRERLGENQPAFASRLTAEARRLGLIWLRYDNTIVSKLENGSRDLSIDDTVVVASVDPDGRGKAWLAWNEKRDAPAESYQRVAERTALPVEKGAAAAATKPRKKLRGA